MVEGLQWNCSVCGEPIADKTGYLAVDIPEAHRVQQGREDWNPSSFTTLDEVPNYPRTVPWLSYHRKCDPSDERGPVRIRVEHARSPWDLLAWSAQLANAYWLGATDWFELMKQIASRHGGGGPRVKATLQAPSHDPGDPSICAGTLKGFRPSPCQGQIAWRGRLIVSPHEWSYSCNSPDHLRHLDRPQPYPPT